MFLREFSTRQRHALLVLARAVIRADGRIDDRERNVLEQLAAEGGMPSDVVDLPIEEASSSFVTAPERRAAMIELIAVAWIDQDVADAEARLLDMLADGWSIGAAERDDMVDWVRRQTSLYAEVRSIVGLDD